MSQTQSKTAVSKDLAGISVTEDKSTTILLVEDNAADAVLVKEYLNAEMGDEITLQWTEKLSGAFELVKSRNIEAILLDLGLPDSKGFSTFEKAHNVCPHIPIIILTGFEDGELAAKAVRAGAQDYLVKGLFTPESLRRSVHYSIERKRAQEALQESQRTLSTLMSNLPGMAYRCLNDLDWTMHFVSEGAFRLTGYMPSELIHSSEITFANLIHPEDRDRVWKDVQTAIDCGTAFKIMYRIITKENRTKWVWEQGCGVYDEKGRFEALEGFISDISEQVEFQNKLRKFSAAVNQAANMICITNSKGIVEYVNPAFVEGTGFTYKEAFGNPLWSLKVAKNNEKYFDKILESINLGKKWNDKVQFRHKSGDLYWEQINVSTIYDDAGKVTHALFVSTDITGDIETQQQLMDADKMSAVGLLAAGVAHEFKNYLGGIIGYASYAESALESPRSMDIVKDTLAQIMEIGERANEVAMSLLTYSRVKSSVLTQQDLKGVINKTLELFSKELKSSCVQVNMEIEDVPNVNASPGRIQQVVLNLLINARDAIDKHGNILVSLKRVDNTVQLKVSDNGVGIANSDLTKIFDPFFSTKGVWGNDKVVGTGMGLSVSRNIAREHGGNLTVESVVGQGSTFTLTLPVAENADDFETSTATDEFAEECKGLAVISMNEKVIAKYSEQIKEVDCHILEIDSYQKLEKALKEKVNLVMIDAKFSGKVELHNMIEACHASAIPFIMVNCGAMEYQLNDMYASAAAIYRDCPELKQIVMQFRSNKVLRN